MNSSEIFEKRKENYNNIVRVQFIVYGNSLTIEKAKKWFEKMATFEIHQMSGSSATGYSTRRYNQEKLYSGLQKDMEKGHGYIRVKQKSMEGIALKVELQHRGTHTEYEALLRLDYFNKKKEEILKTLNELFIEFECMVGYLTIYFDDVCIQNPYWKKEYTQYGLDLSTVKIIPSEIPGFHDDTIDIQSLPGHQDNYCDIPFKSCYGMWFGPDFYKFFLKNRIENFTECYENIALGNDYRRILLYQNIAEYDDPKHRQRQWAFRNFINMEETVHELIRKPFIPKDPNSDLDPEIEFNHGQFEHGGDFIAKHYFDMNEKPVVKSKSVGYYYIEYKNHQQIFKGKAYQKAIKSKD